jgi:hypothetical protein
MLPSGGVLRKQAHSFLGVWHMTTQTQGGLAFALQNSVWMLSLSASQRREPMRGKGRTLINEIRRELFYFVNQAVKGQSCLAVHF